MRKSILWQGIESLKYKEAKRFKNFVSSEYFNQRKEVVLLVEVLLNYKFDLKLIPTKQELIKKILGPKGKDQELRLLMSYVSKLLEKFWVVETVENESEVKLLKLLRSRNLSKQYEAKFKNISKQIAQNQRIGIDKFYQQYIFHLERYEANTERNKPLDLAGINTNFDIYYFLNRLKFTCDNLLHQHAYDLPKSEDTNIEKHIEFLKASGLIHHPYLTIYYHIHNFLMDLTLTDSFYQYQVTIKSMVNQIPKKELLSLYSYGLNYCNLAPQDLTQESFQLYKEGLEAGIFTLNNMIDKFNFRNISGQAIRCNEIEWAENFIEEYKNLLPDKDRSGSYHLNKAVLEFHKKNYQECLFHLQEADYKDMWFALAAKCGICKCYVELGESEALHYALNAMEQFVRRNNVGHLKDGYMNFIRITRLFDRYYLTNTSKLASLSTRIKQTEKLVERPWLLEKINQHT